MVTGTAFDVHRESGATLVTVMRGRVAVSASDRRARIASVGAGEQVRVTDGEGPGRVTPADVERNTAWLHRQLMFEREPLAAVATEFNRYSILPIEIETAALRTVPITGVFSVDDTETFLDFLRTFPGVVVQTTSTRIRVFEPPPVASGQSAAPPPK